MTILASFVNTFHENMKVITADNYKAMNNNTWWTSVAKTMKTKTKTEQLAWFLNTARIEVQQDGQTRFADLFMQQHEVTPDFAGVGFTLAKSDLEDVDVNLQSKRQAAAWAKDVGVQAAYWPQRSVADAIKANPDAYDGVSFFNDAHPLNPNDTAAGTFSNLFNTATSKAAPIDSSVTVDVALTNLFDATTRVAEVKTSNGQDPRNLVVTGILHPPALTQRVAQLTEAEILPQQSAGGAGSADVKMLTSRFGLGSPIRAVELAASNGGSDTAYYLLTSEIMSDELGAFVYVERDPFIMLHNNPTTDAELARTKVLEWHMDGRNTVSPGHPYMMFKCDT